MLPFQIETEISMRVKTELLLVLALPPNPAAHDIMVQAGNFAIFTKGTK